MKSIFNEINEINDHLSLDPGYYKYKSNKQKIMLKKREFSRVFHKSLDEVIVEYNNTSELDKHKIYSKYRTIITSIVPFLRIVGFEFREYFIDYIDKRKDIAIDRTSLYNDTRVYSYLYSINKDYNENEPSLYFYLGNKKDMIFQNIDLFESKMQCVNILQEYFSTNNNELNVHIELSLNLSDTYTISDEVQSLFDGIFNRLLNDFHRDYILKHPNIKLKFFNPIIIL